MIVIALVLNRQARARLAEGLRGRGVVQFCGRLAELRQLVRRTSVGGVVVEPRDADGLSTAPCVAAIKNEMPHVSLVAYFPMRADISLDVVGMVKAGADSLLFLNAYDSLPAIQAVFRNSRVACSTSLALAELSRLIPATLHPVAEYCLTNAGRSLSVLEVARVYGLHRKTLTNRFLRGRLVAPSTFIGWCRLLAVADRIVSGDQPLEAIALEFDFPSAGALRGMLKRYLGLRPQQLGAFGGADYVLDQFRLALGRADYRQRAPGEADRQELLAG